MPNQPKRRPINVASAEKADVTEVTESTPMYTTTKASIIEDKVEETQETQKPVTEKTPAQIAPETIPDPTSDEDWEKKIAEAKANVEKQKTEDNASVGNISPDIVMIAKTPEELPPDETPSEPTQKAIDMEAEIERRVAERLAAQQKKEAPKVEEKKEVDKAKEAEDLANKHAEIAKKNNASGLIFVNLGDDDDFEAAISREFEDDARPDSEKTRNPSDYAAGMSLIRELGQRTQQQKLLKEWIDAIVAKNPDALKAVEDRLRINKITPRIGNGTGPKRLSGTAAKAAVISRMKGMFRIQLYNSGFWIDICPPSLVDIDNWMQEVDQEFKELGRCLGGHAHTCIDVFLKQKLCEIIPGLIQNSNYENWEDKDALMKNVSFHDYDTMLWGLCCSMYKDGIGIGVYCTNPDCRNVDQSQYLDIARLCYLNTEKFPAKALEWMTTNAHNSAKMLTDDDLANYRNNLLGFTKTISVEGGANVYELTVPSITEFINRGASLVGKITALTNGEKNVQNEIVTNQLTFHLYKMMLPWIKSLSMNDSEGNLVYKIEDPDAIYESLDINTFDNSDFYKDITTFIEDTKLSFYAAHTLECPKCGKKAELDKDNLFPLDLQYVFFGLCCLQMNQTGASF